MKTLWILSFLVAIASPLFSQEELTRRQQLENAQKLLLEEHLFTSEEIVGLENLRVQAQLNKEAELALDLGTVIFAARITRSSITLTQDSNIILTAAWEKESFRRNREMTKDFMNGTAGTLALLAGATLGAGFYFFEKSNYAFEQYSTSTFNSPESIGYRKDYQTNELISYGCMAASALLFTLATRVMFLQN